MHVCQPNKQTVPITVVACVGRAMNRFSKSSSIQRADDGVAPRRAPRPGANSRPRSWLQPARTGYIASCIYAPFTPKGAASCALLGPHLSRKHVMSYTA